MPKPDQPPHSAVSPDTVLDDEKKGPESNTLLKKKIKKAPTTVKEDRVSRLEKYEELDKNHPLNRPFTGSPSFRGPVFKRKYTNLLCIFIFLFFNGLFGLYGIVAYKDGASGRLTRGNDFRAEICGIGKLKARKYLYYASPSVDLNVRFCVESCPSTAGQQICLYDVDPTVMTPFCYTQGSTQVSGRFCLPDEPIDKKIVDTELSKPQNLIKRIAGDLGASFDMIVVGIVIALLLAAIFLRSMFDPKKIKYIIWGSIWGTVIVILIMAWLLYREYENTIAVRCIMGVDKRGCGGFKAYAFRYACYGFCGFAFIYMFFIMKIFNKINLGVGVLMATARCSQVISQIRFFSWALAGVVTFVAGFFFIGTVWGFSVGEVIVVPTENIDGGYSKIITYDNRMRMLVAFNFFMLQWWLNVILLVSDCVISYSISIWFFEKRKETVVLPVRRIIKDVLKYHLGTIIQLSLYKIIFRPGRIILSLFVSILRKPQQHRNIVRLFQACCLCCIHAYERSLRYQSKHAVVQMIMWGESFRISSKRAWFLLFRHRGKIRNLDSLVTFILFLTKIVCCLCGGLLVYAYIYAVPKTITGTKTSEIETPLAPALLVFYVGFFFSSIFQSVLDIANKSILQCYLMDSEMFVGEQRFAEQKVLDFMEFFKEDTGPEEKFGKLQQYFKGMKATLNPNIPIAADEDIDAEENKKFDREKPKPEGSDEEGEEEQEEEGSFQDNAPKKDSDDDSDEDDSDEDDDDDDESSDGDERPDVVKRDIFGSSLVQFSNIQKDNNADADETSPDFGKSIPTLSSLQNSQIQFKQGPPPKNTLLDRLNVSNHPINLGNSLNLNKSSNLSFFGRDRAQSRDGPNGSSDNALKREEEKKQKEKREDEEDDDEEDDDDDEEDESEEDDDEEKKNNNDHDHSKTQNTLLFGNWAETGPKGKPRKNWRPLEMSGVTNNLSSFTRLDNTQLIKDQGSDTRLDIHNASVNTTRVVEKGGASNNTMRSDKHNIFNKSKIADNTTMKLEYDDDEEANMKYRL